MNFQIGDRVVINKKGFNKYGHDEGSPGYFGNPKCEGTVKGWYHGKWVLVTWDNGSRNSYAVDTLDLVITSLENE